MKKLLLCIAFLVATIAASAQTPTDCKKNITLFIASGGQLREVGPAFAYRWIEKNRKKYKGICFAQYAQANIDNYAMVFSENQGLSYGFQPVLHTSTSTSIIPINGSGTFTSSDTGATWQYTYNGTETTTTTTQSRQNAPYTDSANTLYITTYSATGAMISRRWRTFTSRQGGDAANTFGYNLGRLCTSSATLA